MAHLILPPIAKEAPREFNHFGDRRIDPYHWMREREDPAVLDYVKAENAYTESVFQDFQPLVDTVYHEIVGRIQQTDITAPYRSGGYFYYTRTVEGEQYFRLCRRPGSLEAEEQVLLDVNEMAKGRKYFSASFIAASPDHSKLAYATDTTGYREYTLQVKDLVSGELLPDRLDRIAGVVWAEDGHTLLYSKEQAGTKREYQIWSHTLGTPASQDTLVYEEPDERFRVAMGKSVSREYLWIDISSGETTEVRYAAARRPQDGFRVLLARREGIQYEVDHHSDRFYFRINDTSRNFRVVTAPVDDPAPSNWREVVSPRPDLYVESVLALRDHVAYLSRVDGLPRLTIEDLRTGQSHDVVFDEASYVLQFGQNAEFESDSIRFTYSSMVTPLSIYDYDLTARTRVLVKRQEVLGGYDPAAYAMERVMANSADGTRVPMTIAYKKGFRQDGAAPALLYGYGAYAYPNDPAFSSVRLSLLDRGFAYALAHVRGGADLGYSWYEAGKLMAKKNSFDDFIACAEYLTRHGYTRPDRLAIEGASAGGLLVGAAVTMRPELFHTVVAGVPFVDVLNSLLDTTLPLTTTDADEFGSPLERPFYDYIKSYSPYENTQPARYPGIYIFGSMNDSQVAYWEPVKWTARLRKTNRGDNKILLRMNIDAGHGGASGRYERYKEIAKAYAFVISRTPPHLS